MFEGLSPYAPLRARRWLLGIAGRESSDPQPSRGGHRPKPGGLRGYRPRARGPELGRVGGGDLLQKRVNGLIDHFRALGHGEVSGLA